MFYILIEKAIENGCQYKQLKKVDVFEFIRNTRKLFVKDDLFRKLIDSHEFPITIGIQAFKNRYESIYKFQ